MIGLTSLKSNGQPFVPPKLNHRRAVFVLAKIDEILAWEQRSEQERDTRFVELGRYLCEVRAGQYWRIDNLKSFDEFLERKFPESRRKAYYLMSVHEAAQSPSEAGTTGLPRTSPESARKRWLEMPAMWTGDCARSAPHSISQRARKR